MKTIYFDCFSGISGDMTIGALLDLGLDFQFLKTELSKLGVTGYELSLAKVDRSGINAAKFDVAVSQPARSTHSHHHHEPHSHHDHQDDPSDGRHSHDHRSLSTISHLISQSALSERVKVNAIAIFERIGRAEAKVHGADIEKVQFHEVGAIDSIVDIVGSCIGLEALGIERVLASPLRLGCGTFTCAHGTYPVPGPATTEILVGVPAYAGDVEGEMVTPTGAAILAELSEGFQNLPSMVIEKTGYGAGTRTYKDFPNVLRAIMGELAGGAAAEVVTVIETNIDDLNPQVYGHLMELAFETGALDVFYTPVQMKKNRPGTLLTVLCQPENRGRLTDLIFRETSTIGIRYREERRVTLQREFGTVQTPYGEIRIKIARKRSGEIEGFSPEFEDCHRAAVEHGVALQDVQSAAIRLFKPPSAR